MSSAVRVLAVWLGFSSLVVLSGCGNDTTTVPWPSGSRGGPGSPDVSITGDILSHGTWSDVFATHALNGSVYALFPFQNTLVVGGQFTRAGDLPARFVARWTGGDWDAYPSDPGGVVRAFAAYNGKLVAAGDFGGTESAVGNLLLWDGTAWAPLGSGLNNTVRALAVFNGDLIAGGVFTGSGDVPIARIARWDGSGWLPLGDGLGGTVNALLVHDDYLYAGGRFGVRRWNGLTWENLVTGDVAALAFFREDLIAGGSFTSFGKHIARWNGISWSSMGSGMDLAVTALTVYHGDLIAAGGFTMSGGKPVSRVARWDGTSWQPLASGVNWVAWALVPSGHSLFVGGSFSAAGGEPSRGIARWDD